MLNIKSSLSKADYISSQVNHKSSQTQFKSSQVDAISD